MRQRRRGSTTPPFPGNTPVAGDGDAAASPRRRPEPLVTPTDARAKAKASMKMQTSRHRSEKARHPVVFLLNFVLFFIVITLIAGIAGVVIGRDMYVASGPLAEDVQLNIPRGASVQSIAAGLEAQEIISNQYVFLAAAYTSGATKNMKAGEYEISARSSMAEVLAKIVSGEVVQHQITIAEGLTSAQVVKRLNADDRLTGTIRSIPPEGSLLPETFAITRGMSRDRVLEMMRDAHDRVLREAWENRDPDLPLTSPEELVTLASIVEKETGQPDERDHVAGVFVNRLNRRMRLQSDPTILYGLYGGEAWDEGRTLTKTDLNRPNSYNTYQIAALPPGPITNPGREAMMATANPLQTDDVFFVADGTGGHVFAVTYEEHLANVAKWREIERNRASANAATTQ
ncbi:endolytic transglycosylase MltG [Acuticoccus sp. MNP-M23]|uniref:endolytic transglycosylase MltG n=1 Tax=Acuticoccus sp. MNP-M23 TaxID=3072793 RepID=UPI00281525F8|nr:endolytic transglycosylase MltG [Acuticoccus sp. MNP-M23]WMS41277.1 endolytic transglycosylase MltG [Acuticoccus sp. MNP-M23]